MQKIAYGLIALLIFSLSSCGPTHIVVESNQPAPAPPPPPPPPAPEVSYQAFYDDLSPYGQWIDYPQYGYVWMPNAGPDFKPYATNGHWVYSDNGWIWSSDYSWGWVTFHYGRWFYEDGYGWMWIPGYEWAPAWVSWRRSDDYYGWAPLGPSVTISASFGGGYNPPSHYWNFVPQQYVTSPHINNYYVNEQRNVTIINNTTVIRNTTIVNNTVNNTTIVNNNTTNNHVVVNNYAGGPDPQEVSRVTGAPLRPVALRTGNTPGERTGEGSLTIYRPRVNPAPQNNNGATGGSQPRFAPAHVQTLNNTHPVNTNSYNNNRGNINNTNTTNNTTNNTNINPNPPAARPPAPNPPAPNPPAPRPVNANPAINPPAGTYNSQPVNPPAGQTPVQNPQRPRTFQTPGQPASGQPTLNHPALQSPNQGFTRPPAPNNANTVSKPLQPVTPPKTYNQPKPMPKKDTTTFKRRKPE